MNLPRVTRYTMFMRMIAVVDVSIYRLVLQRSKRGRVGGMRTSVPLLVVVKNICGLHFRRLQS